MQLAQAISSVVPQGAQASGAGGMNEQSTGAGEGFSELTHVVSELSEAEQATLQATLAPVVDTLRERFLQRLAEV